MSFFSFRKPKEVSRKLPQVGEVWHLKSKKDDPFPAKGANPITVLDVKAGWVRYKIGSGWLFPDERQPIDTFLYCYSDE
jgi:hypothetical protein